MYIKHFNRNKGLIKSQFVSKSMLDYKHNHVHFYNVYQISFLYIELIYFKREKK